MKAIVANFSSGREALGRVRSRLFGRADSSHGISVELADIPEPTIIGQDWVKIRTIMSGISEMDEGLVLRHNHFSWAPYLAFPFVPGNENMGIVTETGAGIADIEIGERAVVDPILSCKPRGLDRLCPSCAGGEPSWCLNFAGGSIGPGIMIGACPETGGGWGGSFLAHRSQVKLIPRDMESDQAVLVPVFARAVKAVLCHPPADGEKVVIVGGGSLGLLMLIALEALRPGTNVLLIAEHSFEADAAARFSKAEVAVSHGPGTAFEDVAKFAGATVRYNRPGRTNIEGGADLVYETTGKGEYIEDAVRFAGEGKRLVLAGFSQPSGIDLGPVWFKGIEIRTSGFSGAVSYHNSVSDVFDLTLELVRSNPLPVSEILTHRFRLEDYRQAFAAIENRASSKAIKVIFHQAV